MRTVPPELKNIREILKLERETLGDPSVNDRMTDAVSSLANSAWFVVIHAIWFATWIAINAESAVPFDPYPYNLLTLAVSLEAIILTGFVLRAQNRLTQQAD